MAGVETLRAPSERRTRVSGGVLRSTPAAQSSLSKPTSQARHRILSERFPTTRENQSLSSIDSDKTTASVPARAHMRLPRFARTILAAAAAAALAVLLLVPDPFALLGWVSERGRHAVESGIPDKLQHAIAYSVLSLVLLCVFTGTRRRRAAWTIALAISHGAATEYLQRFVPHRQSDWYDLLANAAGILVATAAATLFLRPPLALASGEKCQG